MNSLRIFVGHEGGSDVSGRALGRQIRLRLVNALADSDRVVLDFSGVQCASESFLDELVAVLVAKRGKPWFKERVAVVNAAEHIRHDILKAVRFRLGEKRESLSA